MSFWRELRRRHIFRIAIVYAAVAWLVLQLGSIVFPALHAPAWAMSLLISFIVLGFPVALVLAWAFEMTPEGVRRTEPADAPTARSSQTHHRVGQFLNALIIVVLVAAVMVLGLRQFGVRSVSSVNAQRPHAVAKEPTHPAAPSRSIAVLPFENLSGDKNNGYFADGMQDMILTKLAEVGDLKVISRTSTSRYSSHPQDIEQIGRALGVGTVLEGSVQKAGNQVLINVQLIDAGTDSHIWAQAYTRTLDNVFGVEGEVAAKIAHSLNAHLSHRQQRQLTAKPTTSKTAYDAYLHGLAVQRVPTVENFAAVPPYFQEAVKQDPEFAEAWARLAIAQVRVYWAHLDHSRQRLDEARRALEQAKRLAPDAGITFLAQGAYYYYGLLDYARALPEFKQAMKVLPNNAFARLEAAAVERRLGMWDDALKDFQTALDLDPLDPGLLFSYARALVAMRKFGPAIDILDRDLAVSPSDSDALNEELFAYLAQGDMAGAGKIVARLVRIPVAPIDCRCRVVDYEVYLHHYDAARKRLHELLARPPGSTARVLAARVFSLQQLAQLDVLTGKRVRAHKVFLESRAIAEQVIKQDPTYLSYLLLSTADAGLGNKAAALEEKNKALGMPGWHGDHLDGVSAQEWAARIDTMLGRDDDAIATIRHLLSVPYGEPLTPAILRIDPSWAPLREDPEFQALLAQASPDGTGG